MALVVGILGAQACGCSGSQGASTGSGSGSVSPVGQFIVNAENCAKAEAASVASGISVLDVANAVSAIFAIATGGSGAIEAVLESAVATLIGKYGEPIIACAVVQGENPPPTPVMVPVGSGSGSGSAVPVLMGASVRDTQEMSLRRAVAKRHGWQ